MIMCLYYFANIVMCLNTCWSYLLLISYPIMILILHQKGIEHDLINWKLS